MKKNFETSIDEKGRKYGRYKSHIDSKVSPKYTIHILYDILAFAETWFDFIFWN